MAEPQSPFEYDDTHYFTAAERLPAGHPTRLLEALRDKLPAENKELPKPRFLMDPRAISLVNMIRGGLDTAGRWLEGKPGKLKSEDMLGPLGGAGLMAAGMTKPVAGSLGAFIGPGQVDRLGLSPGSRGSLEALEKAQATWAKGGTDPGALAETWTKHGWAPPESFGVRGGPFSWLELPELRIRDKLMDQHGEALAQGRMHTSDGYLTQMLEPSSDLIRLMRAEPDTSLMQAGLKTSPGISYQGAAGVAVPRGQKPISETLKPFEEVPPANYVVGAGPDPANAASILLGHELRGHAMPQWGGTQLNTLAERQRIEMPIRDTRAMDKLVAEREAARKRSAAAYADPKVPPHERSVASRWVDTLREMQDRSAVHAGYFNKPEERMARHAHILDQLERGGANPFAPEHAPGVMSTYGKRGTINDDVFAAMVGNDGLYKLRDLVPRTKPLTADDLAPFMAAK